MIEAYSINLDDALDKGIDRSLMKLVSQQKQARIERFRHKRDAMRCLLGDLLSRYALCAKSGLRNHQLKFDVNPYNKPFLAEPAGFHYNISHSGKWVVCAVGDQPVGIDIEQVKEIDLDVANTVFTKEEYDSFIDQDQEHRLSYFYTMWVIKESYMKADGRGMSLPLKSFTIKINDCKILIDTENELKACFFKTYIIDDQHIASICSTEDAFCKQFRQLNLFEIVKVLEA